MSPSPGALPTWLRQVSDDDVRQQVGLGAFSRGVAYLSHDAVRSVETGDNGRMLLATVQGSGAGTYQTLVIADPQLPDQAVTWSGRCSCPMQADCKHVVAVLLKARQQLAESERAAVPAWEAQLAELVRDVREVDRVPLGLQVEVFTRKPTRYAYSTDPVTELRLRPVIPGKAGGWVKTGASWYELEFGYSVSAVEPQQREAVLALLTLWRTRQGAYASSYADPQVHIGAIGHRVWPALRAAVDAGVALVPVGKGGVPVHLADAPASVLLDLRQPSPGADAELSAVVRMPGEPDRSPDDVGFVGEPLHGLYLAEPNRMLLAPLDRPLDDATGRLLESVPVQIPAEGLPRFVAVYYPTLRQRIAVASTDGSVHLPEVEPPVLTLHVAFGAGHSTRLHWGFGYRVDGELVRLPIARGDGDPPRDRAAEDTLLASLSTLDAVPGLRVDVGAGRRRLLPDSELAGLDTAAFVDRVLPDLLTRHDVLVDVDGTPAEYVEAADAPLITVSATDVANTPGESQSDWFDLGVTVTVAGQQVPFAPLFTALARGDDHLILDSGTWFRLDHPELHALSRLIDEARSLSDRPGAPLRVTRWQAGLWDELVSLGVVDQQSQRWQASVGALLDLDTVPKSDPPAGLLAHLRPYQLDGYHWLCLLWDHQLGGVLADDMGLGKTLQALAMVARAHEQGDLVGGPVLIVAPTSVVSTWAGEAARFCPGLTVATVTETDRRSAVPLAKRAAGAQVVVTSYALLRIDEEAYRALPWSGLVLDEAQFVKNHQAKTYQSARRLAAPFKLAITGTPLENSLMDLWSLLSIVAPGLFPSPQRFTDLYRKPIESGAAPERLASLRRRIRPLMLRRTKDQVARDLPPKVEQVLSVVLNPAHRRVYDQHLQRERQRVLGLIGDLERNRIAIFRSLTLLRQLSLDASLVDARHAGRVRSSKVDAFLDTLREVVDEGHRALVFSQFTGFLGLVRERLDAESIGYAYLDGRTRDRPRRIAEFTGGSAPVFLISLKAGGFGLTLTEADYVFVLDPWWNPAAEAQAIDRTHRIGQDKTVMVYRLVAKDTIEEKVVELQQRKRDLFTKVVDDGAAGGAALTADDIRGLLEV